MAILTLALKGEYFDQVKLGTKTLEYREANEFWRKRLQDREYDQIVLTRGYPQRSDTERRMTFPWRGYVMKTITHPHFGNVPTDVYAIRVGNQ